MANAIAAINVMCGEMNLDSLVEDAQNVVDFTLLPEVDKESLESSGAPGEQSKPS